MILVPTLIFGFMIRFSYLGTESKNIKPKIGLENAMLKKCPEKPNCINSFYPEDKEHYIAPLELALDINQIESKLNAYPEFQLIKKDQKYMYYINESKIFGFIDDIEIYLTNSKVYFRSASRVGYSDLGANLKRIEKIKKILSNN